jgi:hypothetical protein
MQGRLVGVRDVIEEAGMKRTRSRRTKQNPTRQKPADGVVGVKKKNPATADLPPNDKVNKYADEIYGDTEIPSRA